MQGHRCKSEACSRILRGTMFWTGQPTHLSGPSTQKSLCLNQCRVVLVWKFWTVFTQGPLHAHFALIPANDICLQVTHVKPALVKVLISFLLCLSLGKKENEAHESRFCAFLKLEVYWSFRCTKFQMYRRVIQFHTHTHTHTLVSNSLWPPCPIQSLEFSRPECWSG